MVLNEKILDLGLMILISDLGILIQHISTSAHQHIKINNHQLIHFLCLHKKM